MSRSSLVKVTSSDFSSFAVFASEHSLKALLSSTYHQQSNSNKYRQQTVLQGGSVTCKMSHFLCEGLSHSCACSISSALGSSLVNYSSQTQFGFRQKALLSSSVVAVPLSMVRKTVCMHSHLFRKSCRSKISPISR